MKAVLKANFLFNLKGFFLDILDVKTLRSQRVHFQIVVSSYSHATSRNFSLK